jgi:hypothetical protein
MQLEESGFWAAAHVLSPSCYVLLFSNRRPILLIASPPLANEVKGQTLWPAETVVQSRAAPLCAHLSVWPRFELLGHSLWIELNMLVF